MKVSILAYAMLCVLAASGCTRSAQIRHGSKTLTVAMTEPISLNPLYLKAS